MQITGIQIERSPLELLSYLLTTAMSLLCSVLERTTATAERGGHTDHYHLASTFRESTSPSPRQLPFM